MGRGDKVFCVLCQRSEETEITGALSTKQEVTAHQNCLLYSSGIYCRDSPEFDDLFGFSVDDVLDEVRRGRLLVCKKCKKKGATAGCEVKRCKKSYHYPCAVQDGAKIIENANKGNYGLYCLKHRQENQNNGSVKSRTSKNANEAGSSKAPPSQKRNTTDDSTAAGPSAYSSDSNSSSSVSCLSKRRLSFNDKQEGIPSKRKSKGCKRILSEDSSNSDENELYTEMAMFAPLESDLDETANSVTESQLIRKDSKSPTASTSVTQLEVASRDDEDETMIDSDAESESLLLPVEMCIESGLSLAETSAADIAVTTVDPGAMSKKAVEVVDRENKGSSPEHSSGQHTAGPSVPQQSTSGPSVPQQSTSGPSVPQQSFSGPSVPQQSTSGPSVPQQSISGPSVPQQRSAGPPLSPDHSKPCSGTGLPQCTTMAISPPSPETICVSLLSSSPSPSPTVRRSDPESSVDSTGFWKSCNAAGCTQAIFTDFINEMNHISSRIQSDQASQEDYDLALKVMLASGKLADLVTKQQKELQRKQMELQKAAAAMKDVVSALRR
ncbi:uncharacterized protein C6orf132 isoform X2 [Micropterus dolomieu]|uniref:uncharacterized protein C6orf132 isoform X2 n=1 Tax=Micropterus dolomieu TaxID=147949 RepID=UPI001E8EECBC|nr:uncharacterized protein C6orf132 isoform X2 [Micropterus dolomieu]